MMSDEPISDLPRPVLPQPQGPRSTAPQPPLPPPPPSAFSLPPGLLPSTVPGSPLPPPPPPPPTPANSVAKLTTLASTAMPSVEIAMPEVTNESHPPLQTENDGEDEQSDGTGMFAWLQKAVSYSPFLTKVADKAKSGMGSMMTTLDPQMKDFLAAEGGIELCVASDLEQNISAIKAGFHRVFSSVTGRGLGTPGAGDFPDQVIGYAAAVEACIEKCSRLRKSGLVLGKMPIVAMQALLVELFPDGWHWAACILMAQSDNRHFYAFTQPIHVPPTAIQLLKERTPSSHPFASFACPLETVLSELFSLEANNWQLHISGISKSDLLGSAAIVLANQYKNAIGSVDETES